MKDLVLNEIDKVLETKKPSRVLTKLCLDAIIDKGELSEDFMGMIYDTYEIDSDLDEEKSEDATSGLLSVNEYLERLEKIKNDNIALWSEK